MKLGKINLLLLALLVAAMVPCISADDQLVAAEITDSEVKKIFDSASGSENIPQFQNPEAETAYLEAYVSPAQKAIGLMQTKRYTQDQISATLKKNGYGWDPETGACWKGRDPTPEEQKYIDKIRGSNYSPFPEPSKMSDQSAKHVDDWRQHNAMMNLVDVNTYFGINYDMRPGDMAISTTGTIQHVVTAHVGKKRSGGQDDWTEAGVARSVYSPDLQLFTYDNDEGQWQFHGIASSVSYKTYKIYVTNTLESGRYLYHIWIDGSWVRDGHLYNRQTQFNCANEIWADGSYPFSQDSTSAIFQNEYLYKSTGTQNWGDYPATITSFSRDSPPYESHPFSGSSWRFITYA